MADYFENKDYSDYFKSLENRINSEELNKPAVTDTEKEKISKSTYKKPKQKKLFVVFRLKKSVLAVFSALILCIVTIIVVTNVPKKSDKPKSAQTETSSKTETAENKVKKVSEIKYFQDSETTDIPSDNDCAAGIVIDKTKNRIVAVRNGHKRMFPASTVKIMTVLVAAENIKDFNQTFTMTLSITDPLYIAEATVAGFSNKEEVNMTDLLYGTILPSGADAATALAITVAGSEENFVKLMNNKVKELGLKDTHFDNATGLHSENNYTSAYDLAVILDAAMQNDICKKVLSTYQYTTAKTLQHPDGILLSSTLFSYMYGTEPETATILGGKTGFVNESGYCVASFGKANSTNNPYIVVTLHNSSKWPAFYGQIALYKEFAK